MAGLRGKMVIAQSGGPTAVINASLAGVMLEAKRHGEIEAVYGALDGILGVLNEEMIDLGREAPETVAALTGTPSAVLGSCRYRLSDDDHERVLAVFRGHDVRYFLYIGGNDSMDTAQRLTHLAAAESYELRVIGIPKTVDNDLAHTDHCPGYGSAARFIALAVRDAGRDTEAMGGVDPVKIIEVAGRNSGWLAAAAALAREDPDDAPHLVYMPERPVGTARFLEDVRRVYNRLGRVVAVVTETMRDESGCPIEDASFAGDDAFGHPRRAGVAATLCRLVEERLGLRSRFDKPGTLQRVFMSAVSLVDVQEAVLVGENAVRRALEGATGQMVTLERIASDPYRSGTGLVELAEVANVERRLPDEFIAPGGNDVTPAFVDYARPLIGGSLPPYARLERHPVPPRSRR